MTPAEARAVFAPLPLPRFEQPAGRGGRHASGARPRWGVSRNRGHTSLDLANQRG
jgi:hypothetical protein